MALIQSDKGTFEREPEGAPELFQDWQATFALEEHKGEMGELLAASPALRAAFADLVPAHMSTATFWSRYFYKVHQFQLDIARRSALLKRSALVTPPILLCLILALTQTWLRWKRRRLCASLGATQTVRFSTHPNNILRLNLALKQTQSAAIINSRSGCGSDDDRAG